MWQQVAVCVVLVAALAMFIWGRWRYDLVALAALLTLAAAGIVPAAQVFSGFAHPAVVTVAAVLVVSRALTNAGVTDYLSRWVARLGGPAVVQLAALTALVTVLSAFINNVGALSLLMPVAIRMARSNGVSASMFLMPLAFGSLLGGMTTLIGTPPNLLIAEFRAGAVGEPFGMFDFVPVGGAVALCGLAFICLLAGRLIPVRTGPKSADELFEIGNYTAELTVPENSASIGRSIGELTEGKEAADVVVAGLSRQNSRPRLPLGVELLEAGDRLIVEGPPDAIQSLVHASGLEFVSDDQRTKDPLSSDEIKVVEAIVLPDAYLVRRTSRTTRLRWRYGINLLGVARKNARVQGPLREVRLRAGDILLLQGPADGLSEALSSLGCLPLADRELRIGQPRRLAAALLTFAVAVTLAAVGVLPAAISLSAAALLLALSGAVRPRELYESIDWPVIVLLGAMIPVGGSMETTGLADLMVQALHTAAGGLPPPVVLVVMLIATMMLSDVINNAAAVVLLAPIALRTATALDCSPDPFLMAVAVGASCAFLTPIGHQSNTLVMNAGGYRFGDYWRLGLPLEILIVLVSVPLILYTWPLHPTG